jgi:hypothetical protein
MVDRNDSILSESEELLMMRHFDNQCGFFEKSKALRLLNKSKAAAAFYSSLALTKQNTEAALQGACPKADLWDRVSHRIEAEEHAAIFLGKRDVHQPVGFFGKIFENLSPVWSASISGGVVTAGLALYLMFPGATPKAPQGEMLRMVRGVSLDTGAVAPVAHERPRILNEDAPNVVEVDWMRSDGRVSILHAPSERSALIWVKKRNPGALVKQNRRTPIMLERETPLGIQVSTK